MQRYHVHFSHDGADACHSNCVNLHAAIRKAAQISGYTERTVKRHMERFNPPDGYVVGVKGMPNAGVWITPLDEAPDDA